MAAFLPGKLNLAGGVQAERVDGFRVSERYFAVSQVNPLLGRTFLSEECAPGGNRTVLLSHGLWQSHFGSGRDILGRTVILDGYSHTIVGVMPAGSEPYLEPALWVPLAMQDSESGRGYHVLMPIEGRPKPAAGQDLNASFHVVSSSYFATLGIPLKSGRFFTQGDGSTTPLVVTINETLAREQFGGRDAVGQRISIAGGFYELSVLAVCHLVLIDIKSIQPNLARWSFRPASIIAPHSKVTCRD